MNMRYPWNDLRRYNAFSNRIKEKYGGRIQKVSVNAGFTCPNRDGSKGVGGCLYCDNDSFTPSYCGGEKDIISQLDEGIEFLEKRYKQTRYFIAYFQSYSNTYKPLADLKKIYESALVHDRIEGLAVSTRPDCVDEPILDYLAELSSQYFIFLELGIESLYDKTLKRINRGHGVKETLRAIEKASQRELHITGHLLFGLPGESRNEMLNEAFMLSGMPLNALKFHHLQIIKDTPIAAHYLRHPELFELFGMEEYIDFIIRFLERLSPEIAIERLVSEVPPQYRLNEGWGNVRADRMQKKIESVMEERNTWQGKMLKKS